jgi:integrase
VARWRENGRRCSASYATKELAEEVLAKIIRDIGAGDAGLPRDPKDAPMLSELVKPWLARRQKTHRSYRSDKGRWTLHLAPVFGKLRPGEVDAASIRRFVEGKLAKGLAAQTVGHCVRLLSTFFSDVVEMGHAMVNPVASLPRSTRRLYRSTYDVTSTPFLQTLADVRRVFLALPEPVNVAFAVGAFAGLRTGEVLGLSWQDIDLAGKKIHVRQQMRDGALGVLKDEEGRIAPLQNSLAPILAAWRLKTGGEGLLFRPTVADRGGRPDLGAAPAFMRPHTLHKHLAKALKDCGLPSLTWYESTRHTFASLWVMGGGSIELLSKILGHSSVAVTQHYAHMKVDLFAESAFCAMTVDLSQPAGDVVSLTPVSVPFGPTMATKHQDNAPKQLSLIA